ncbi:interleukin-1 beta [Pungitius pungitius]|uniref:interleukin-1 beta n=1 Tax=Pungitius pungitius TaxID=134920 RepID=UPI002E0D3AD6
MCDLDPSEALESSSDLDDAGCESRCFNMREVQEEIIRMDEGLELQVSRDPKTLQMVTTVVMAASRMKRSLGRRGLSNMALCSGIMESLVTETVVTTTRSSSMQPFLRVNSEEVCTLSDVSHKDVICGSGGTILQAMVLKGGHSDHKVSFKLVRFLNPSLSPMDCIPVLLSVTNSNRHISCCNEGGKVVLKLEEYDHELQNISPREDTDRFLFFRRTTGVDLNTFESVRCRGWFIGTPDEDEGQACTVEMCTVDCAHRQTAFKMN